VRTVDEKSMEGRVCLITGGTSGVGKAAASGLARLGNTVVIVGRDAAKGERVAAQMRSASGNPNVTFTCADLSLQASVRSFADSFKRRHKELHVLGNMAGGIYPDRQVTAEGIEKTLATDYLAHFLLSRLLLDLLGAGAPSRIVTVSGGRRILERSRIHLDDLQLARRYSGIEAAKQAALARFIFSRELARRLDGTEVTSNSFHPGTVRSSLARNFPLHVRLLYAMASPFMRQRCDTCLYLAVSRELDGVSGRYFAGLRQVDFMPERYTGTTADRLWEISEELTGMP
jgi:NAD(P)-dependent dehydrogenase (short-subunit alcohol dehydrogenase family)